MQSGARGGVTKGGKAVQLSRKAVQVLGKGNWAKGVAALRSGTLSTKQVNNARAAAAGKAPRGIKVSAAKMNERAQRMTAAGSSTARMVRESRRDVQSARNTLRKMEAGSRAMRRGPDRSGGIAGARALERRSRFGEVTVRGSRSRASGSRKNVGPWIENRRFLARSD